MFRTAVLAQVLILFILKQHPVSTDLVFRLIVSVIRTLPIKSPVLGSTQHRALLVVPPTIPTPRLPKHRLSLQNPLLLKATFVLLYLRPRLGESDRQYRQ